MNDKFSAAFNRWMDDYVNNPDQFKSVTETALQHLREKMKGQTPSYGDISATTFEAYLEQV